MEIDSVPVRVLVVEDEALIAIVLQDMLEDFGCSVVGPAASLEEGERLADAERYDLAILDVRLNGNYVFPLAERILREGRPIIIASGSGGDDLPAGLQALTLLQKPYAAEAVERAVRAAMAVRVGA